MTPLLGRRVAWFNRHITNLLTVHFSPQWTNNPIGEYGPNGLTADRWDPTKFEDNWGFVADVHKLAKAYGPDATHFDFMSEGPPSRYQPAFIIDRMQNYIATMWTRYVAAFGKDDVTVSIIAKGRPVDASDRLQHLIDALRPTGLGFPDWFEVHPDWTSPEVFNQLQAVDATLRANGLLTQPLVIGESSYDNPAVAADIRRFMDSSSRPVSEVYEWWQTTDGGTCLSPPYRADAYITTLAGVAAPAPTPSPLPLLPVPKLSASVSTRAKATFKTASGNRVTALDAGPYTVVVTDRSKRSGFPPLRAGPSTEDGQALRRAKGLAYRDRNRRALPVEVHLRSRPRRKELVRRPVRGRP